MSKATLRRLAGALLVLVLSFSGCTSMTVTPENIHLSNAEYMLGMSYMEQGRTQDAFVEFQKAVHENPENKEAHNMLGYLYGEREQYEEAMASYGRALKIDPRYSEAYNNRAGTLIAMERWDDAIASAEQALLNPLYATPEYALNNIGYAQMKKGAHEEAIKTFKKALRRRPLPQANYNLALIYIELGQDRAALKELQDLVERFPQYALAHYQLARLYLKLGEKEKAREHFTSAATLAPDQEAGILADTELRRLK